MNEAGYDLVAHKHYRERVINMMLVRCEGTRVSRTKRDRKLDREECARVFVRGQLVRSRSFFIQYMTMLDEFRI